MKLNGEKTSHPDRPTSIGVGEASKASSSLEHEVVLAQWERIVTQVVEKLRSATDEASVKGSLAQMQAQALEGEKCSLFFIETMDVEDEPPPEIMEFLSRFLNAANGLDSELTRIACRFPSVGSEVEVFRRRIEALDPDS